MTPRAWAKIERAEGLVIVFILDPEPKVIKCVGNPKLMPAKGLDEESKSKVINEWLAWIKASQIWVLKNGGV